MLGFPYFTHCTQANISDDQGLIEMLTDNIDYFKSKPQDLPKTTILVDNGYHPDKLTSAVAAIYPEMMTKIQFELSPKPSTAQKKAKGQVGFVPVAAIASESTILGVRASIDNRRIEYTNIGKLHLTDKSELGAIPKSIQQMSYAIC
jgi:hypothetical protein